MSSPSTDRFPSWLALSIFSAVCLAASETERSAGGAGKRSADDKWVLSVEVLSMSFSFFACLAYLLESVRERFVAKIPEISFSVLVLILWAGGLPVIMKPIRSVEANANLYFFSWLSLAAAVLIAASLLSETTGRDVRQSSLMQGKTGLWYGFAASTIVVMVASSRIYQLLDCGGGPLTGKATCRRTNLGISLGCIGFVTGVAMAIALTKQVLPKYASVVASAVSLIMWCFGIGFITFGDGPGSTMGNLYFSTWISFILIIVIFAGDFRDYASSRGQGPASSQPGIDRNVEEGGTTVPVIPEIEADK